MRVVLDGSVCFDRFGACFDFYTQLTPRLLAQGCCVLVTPSPTGALESLDESGAVVGQTLLPRGSWLPHGPLRRGLSRVKQAVEKWRWRKQLEGKQTTVFQSFYYGMPPTQDAVFVPMILDMIQERYPEWYGGGDGKLQRDKAECVRRATRIVTISETAKRDIVDIYGVNADKIDVVYLGVNPAFSQTLPAEQVTALKARLGLARPYFLQVGGRAVHKNFARLLEAFLEYARRDEVDLVCAGEDWTAEERHKIARHGLTHRVHLVPKPNQATLVALYKGAEALFYPSLCEGFGIPPLEAMASGIPVAASTGGGGSGNRGQRRFAF